MSIANRAVVVYEWGTRRAHDVPDAPLRYEPLTSDGIPAESASEPWDADEREEWAAAELRDEMAERGYW